MVALIIHAHGFENLAYRRPVYELHPWPTTDKDYGSQNAVDGLYTDRSAAGGQCSISADNNYTEALLRIDLGAVFSINHIRIYFRTENHQRPKVYTSKMAGFFLYVSNTISMDGGHLCFHEIQTEFGTPSENQNISCSVHGRYVIVYNERRPEVVYPNYYSEFAYNEVCEVEVYGCKVGYYDETCMNKCSENCFVPRRCDSVTRQCNEGCQPGWWTKTCEEKCPFGTFGNNCRQECGHCLEKKHCHHINGSCLMGCSHGYRGEQCKDRTPSGIATSGVPICFFQVAVFAIIICMPYITHNF